MYNLLKLWSQRNLSLKGKICIINSLIISLFVYPASILGIDAKIQDEIDYAIFNFLWDNKPAKIAKVVIQSEIRKGGLKMPNIYKKVRTWRLMWLKRAVKDPNRAWVAILDTLLEKNKFY